MKFLAAIAVLLSCITSASAYAYPDVDCRKTFAFSDTTIECRLTWFALDATIYEFGAFHSNYTHIPTGLQLPRTGYFDLDSFPNNEIWSLLLNWRPNYAGQWSAFAIGNIFFVRNDTNVLAADPPPEDTYIGQLP